MRASPSDLESILEIQRMAFKGDAVADLTAKLLEDPTAEPRLSLLARVGGESVGHILFTRATPVENPRKRRASILAPLAVVPDRQRGGVGSKLVQVGLSICRQQGTDIIFVLGHPEYYPRFGFVPAHPLGLFPPFPVSPQNAWMVLNLQGGVLDLNWSEIAVAESLNSEEHWRE